MKCIQCSTDNTLKDRTDNQGRCKSCNRPFAFEPTSMTSVKVTDPFFAKAISDISAENTLFFTNKQLFYLLDKRLENKKKIFAIPVLFIIVGALFWFAIQLMPFSLNPMLVVYIVFLILILLSYIESGDIKNSPSRRKKYARFLQVSGVLVLVLGINFSLGLSSIPQAGFFVLLISLGLGLSLIYYGSRQLARQAEMSQSHYIEASQVKEWLNRWTQVNGTVTKLLPSPREESAPAQVSPEISVYSFDRVVICDSAAIAQLLVANNFHFENNCAVLSITGYPQNIFSTVLEMLRRNPDLKVYALHDASPKGVGLVNRLRTNPNWFKDSNVTIYDLGLLPRQILASRNNIFACNDDESRQQARQMAAEVRQDLSAEELKWLELGNYVELESFSPRKLLQVVTQGIAKSRDPNSRDSLVVIDSAGSDVYVFAADSFG